MKKWMILGLILILGCAETSQKPKNLLNKNQMAEILMDIQLHQQPVYLREAALDGLDYAKTNATIIEKHGTDVKTFKESYKYYVLQPDEYTEILNLIEKDLQSRLPEGEQIELMDKIDSPEEEKQ